MALKVFSVVGARPQFVKAAAVSRAIAAAPGIEETLVHTGQHYDSNMSDIFFQELQIPRPAHHLEIHGGSHGDMTGRMLAGLEKLMIDAAPGCVLVYGDTNSTLAGALAAAKLHLPIAHVEAGLRSYNRRMPEEINRVLTDHLSSLLFCPTQAAVRNLQGEGIRAGVHHVGDVMYDATLAAIHGSRQSRIVESLGLQAGRYSVATVHRAENTDDPAQLRKVIAYLCERAAEQPLLLPLHPRTRQSLAVHGIATDGLQLCEPLGYLDMARLLSQCTAVYTDSGGLQKEAYFHRKPCVTLRSETEWVETVECGWNRLWTVADFRQRLPVGEYGEGKAADEIVRLLQTI